MDRTFTASDDSTEEASVAIVGEYEDVGGNISATGADDTATVDTTNPTIVFDQTAEEKAGVMNRRINVTITFSERNYFSNGSS